MPRRCLSISLILLCAACAGGDARGGARGGVLVIAAPGEADLLMPAIAQSATGRHVIDQIFPKLAELTPSLNTLDDSGFAPALARSWEHRDSTTLVFHLDPRAHWQDGARVTAADVAYTFGVYSDSATGSTFLSNLAQIASVTADDSLTAVFHFRRWYPEQLYDATYHMRVVPKHLLDTIPPARLASAAFARAPVGAGPFRFVRWTAADIVLDADTGYWGERPRLSRLIWRVMPDLSTAVSALLAGDADAVEAVPQLDELARVRADTALALVPYPSAILAFVRFNLRRPPLADRGVRRAIAMATDRATIAHAVLGPETDVPIGAASRMQWVAQLPVRQLGFDTAAAGRLLDSLGWRRAPGGTRMRGGRPLRFALLVPTTSRIRQQGAVLLQGQLKAAGIDMQIQPIEYPVLIQRDQHGDFDALFWSATLDASPSALVGDWVTASAGGGGNTGGYASPRFDSLVAAAVRAPGKDRAGPLYAAALSQMNDDAPALFLFAPRITAVIHRRFQNVTIRPDSWLLTAPSWSIPPERRLPRDTAAGTAAR